ncbi:Signal recognition particle receptor FtsY [Streptococcus salivarius]|jgi:fused signal recognition particle receptor|uniref:Signal recognition particle receptor FtsY n=1 Tax=Streptococcus salivarius TaxID=1304 RepID=A0AAX1YDH0_STRSL|nr:MULTISPECIES: signal recognition particle-docking protein FtsY [Streptococcus]ARI59705.1 signal recognition particle-docking protein FtsY [Streptococcus salivarius]MDB8590534.1 signal recognition particle-docking protein FtsY [Streptococcus salivarius]OFS46507.1 signal recognition particle-docking protein FtsY [Streptococcus sp. HMSC072D03]RSI59528.1 Signal recognition particle receptor FtsY [Streptococcus salivarius]SQF75497.1 cell division protein FtsY [Streptococcus salivarius]
MGLFDRLFGQEENQSQETVANQEISETESLDNQDLSSSEGTSQSQTEQLSESETQVEEISSTESAEESESTVTEESEVASDEDLSVDDQASSEAEGVSESEESQVAVDNHFADVMADYYAKKAQVAAAAEKGETVTFEAVQTRKVEEKPEEVQASKTETEQEKYNRTLKKTRTGFAARLNEFFANFRRVDEEFFEELEEMLILSDVGVNVATQLTEDLRYEARLENVKKTEDLQRLIIEKLVDIYEKDDVYKEQINFQDGLTVMLFVGVNGVGKTTSIGKLAHKYKQEGKKVMLVAADTFRAGAVAQLVEWGRRVDVPVVTGAEKADPASVVFDGMEKALAEGVDVLMIDTAGRLQNKDNLMAELEKIGRIIKRVVPEAPHETLLALDASTGQNALSQAKEFSKITPLTGLVLTKLDGSAKGGVVLAIRQELDIPVKLIGFGEKIDDIGEFHSEEFMQGLLTGLV